MKIRMKGQSVRLRLGQSEVAALARGEAVEESIQLGPVTWFGCEIRPQPAGEVITHHYADNLLTFRIPAGQLADWATTDAVGFSADLSLGNGGVLRLLVEKDFACLTPGDESQADAFPNPSAVCAPIPERA